MSDPFDQPRPESDDETWERMLAKHSPPTPEVEAATAEIEAARAVFSVALDHLTDATRSALDIPSKVRRNPAKAAALVGGTGFLLVGGPRRVVRFVGRRVLPRRPDPHDGLLPAEIEKVLKDSGLAKDPEVRRALDKDFAEYLRRKGKVAATQPNAARSFWRTFDRVAGPLGTAGARVLVQRLMEAERDRSRARSASGRRATPRPEAGRKRAP